jgi:two-component system, OmpR family, phosphate regulon sensor histidine kinase PhoR
MKKRTIVIIAFITFISLVGIVLTQLYWVKKSVNLKEEQFDNGIRIAVKSVLNQLLNFKNDTIFQHHLSELSCRKPKLEISDVILPAMLDSLLQEELGTMYINDKYYYCIYNKNNNKIYYGKYEGEEDKLLNSPFQFSVSNIYQPGDYFLSIYFPAKTSIILRQLEFFLLISIFFIVIVIISFSYVLYVILRQKKVSEMKTDFINNLTHEFKTPIATSSLAAEMLLRPEVETNKTRIKKYAQVILDENQRLQGQVEQVLQIATLDKGQLKLKLKYINIHELLNSVIDSSELRLKENKIKLTTSFDAKQSSIVADRYYILNVLYNLLDNAIKYTPVDPVIHIKTWNVKGGIKIRIEDNGIGINPEHHSNIFKNLFRVPTGNIHEVRGFGLGLYYAKIIIERHNGRIEVDSEQGKGSIFDVYLPFNL